MALKYLTSSFTAKIPSEIFKAPRQSLFMSKMNLNPPAEAHYATVSYVTAPNEDVARELSSKMVESRLVACVNIIKGVESIYEWQGKIEHDTEVMMIIKSSSEKSKDLAKFIQSNHPYECPEVVTLKVESGSEPYLKWIRDTVNKQPIS